MDVFMSFMSKTKHLTKKCTNTEKRQLLLDLPKEEKDLISYLQNREPIPQEDKDCATPDPKGFCQPKMKIPLLKPPDC